MFTFHLHLPICHVCSQRSFFFLCDTDFSSTAECRLLLHMSSLLYEWQLHAGEACKPLPFNTLGIKTSVLLVLRVGFFGVFALVFPS